LSKIDSSKMHPQWLNILSKTTIYSNLRVILLRKLSEIDSRSRGEYSPIIQALKYLL
jgi:hypothetical protein